MFTSDADRGFTWEQFLPQELAAALSAATGGGEDAGDGSLWAESPLFASRAEAREFARALASGGRASGTVRQGEPLSLGLDEGGDGTQLTTGTGRSARARAAFRGGNYGLGLVALGSSSLAGAVPSPAPVLATPAAAADYLATVNEQLCTSLAGLVVAADEAAARGGGGGDTLSSTAAADRARELQTVLASAVSALAATTSGALAGDEAVRAQRDAVFSVFAEAGRTVEGLLKTGGISPSLLREVAHGAPVRGGGGGGGSGGGEGGGGGGGSGGADGGLVQPGLVRIEDNPTRRRMKSVFLSADEILAALQTRLRAVGLARAFGTAKRMARVAAKCLALSSGPHIIKRRNAGRRAALAFMLGAQIVAARARARALMAARVLVVGMAVQSINVRNASRRRTLLLVAGNLAMSVRSRDLARRATVLFAAGLVPMWFRTQGAPAGFTYGVKVTRKPAPKGPRVRGIHWETLTETRGTVWGRRGPAKNPQLNLKELFPDLKSLFTEKERVVTKKGGAAGADGAPAAVEKPKEISFVSKETSQMLGIAISKFKSVPGFNEGTPPARFRVVREALDNLDETKLMGQEGLDIIAAMTPRVKASDKEDKIKAEFEKPEASEKYSEEDRGRLGLCENYVWEIKQVKLLNARVQCMRMASIVKENTELVERDLKVFVAATAEILKSTKLVEFLVDVVRPFGNELNRAGGKKDAAGIRIMGLVKLGATKTADNSMTSLYYIVSVLHKTRPHLLDLCHEFQSCKASARLSMQGITDNFKSVKDSSIVASAAVKEAEKANDVLFLERMGPMAAKIAADVAVLENNIEGLKKALIASVEYLGERYVGEGKDKKERDMTKPELFFAEWFGFIDILSKTYQEFREKEAKKLKKEKEEAAKVKAAEEKAARDAAREAAKKGGGGENQPKRGGARNKVGGAVDVPTPTPSEGGADAVPFGADSTVSSGGTAAVPQESPPAPAISPGDDGLPAADNTLSLAAAPVDDAVPE